MNTALLHERTKKLLAVCALFLLFFVFVILQVATAHVLPFNEYEAFIRTQSMSFTASTLGQPGFVSWLLVIWDAMIPPEYFLHYEASSRVLNIGLFATTLVVIYWLCRLYFATDTWHVWAWLLLIYCSFPIVHYNAVFDLTATLFTLFYCLLLIAAFVWSKHTTSICYTCLLGSTVIILVNIHFLAWVLVPCLLFLLLCNTFVNLRHSNHYWGVWIAYLFGLVPSIYWNYHTNWGITSYLTMQSGMSSVWQDVVTQQLLLTALVGVVAFPIASYIAIKRWSEPNIRTLYLSAFLLFSIGGVFAAFRLAPSGVLIGANMLFALLLIRYISWNRKNPFLGYVWLLSISYGAITTLCFYLLYLALIMPFPNFMSPLSHFLGIKETIALIESLPQKDWNADVNAKDVTKQKMLETDVAAEGIIKNTKYYVFTDTVDTVARLAWYAPHRSVVYTGAYAELFTNALGLAPAQQNMSGYVLLNDTAKIKPLLHKQQFETCELLASSSYKGNSANIVSRIHLYRCQHLKDF